jgi:hypothetical protein
MTRRCTLPGCHRKHRARGYCSPHYDQHYRRANLQRRNRPSTHTAAEAAWLLDAGESLPTVARHLYPDSPNPQASLQRAIQRARQQEQRAAA